MKAAKKDDRHPDRHLVMRGGRYQYRRRVPAEVAHLDKRSPEVRISTKTRDLVIARAIRDVFERSDNELWGALIVDADDDPWSRHEAAQKVAKALGFGYRSTAEVAASPIPDIITRIEALPVGPVQTVPLNAALGESQHETTLISQAWKVFIEKIAPHEIVSKSTGQKKRWENGKHRSVLHFVEVVGDLDIRSITRSDARKYFDHWMERIAPREGAPTHTADIGNRRLGDLSGLYEAYFVYMQEPDRENPFDRLRFKRKGKRKRRRPPFSHKWITDTLLKPGALAGMNAEARGILLVAANTGARLSEVANLVQERILLEHEIPHIKIEPDDDPEDPMEIKTETSIRAIPVTGLSLAVLKKFPSGFPRYRDKGSALSAAVNKYLTENELLETDRHSFYSLRHSFEDRMKNARVDAEVRKILMGHSIDRQEYGEGGSLKLRLEAMEQVSLPFDPSIV